MNAGIDGPKIAGFSEWRRLGAGGHATVYAATEERFRRTVAVKVLHHVDAAGRRRFEREQLAMGQLSHPNIVVPHSSGFTDDGSPYLVLEYLAGGSVAEHIERNGPLAWVDAIGWVLPIVDALGHAHDRSILHRDVKPENILVTGDGVTKLADFGIAAIREATATVTSISFTLAHAPPETFAGGEDLRDERADLYSIVSTLYSMIEGAAPFDRPGKPDSQLAYMARIADQPVVPLAGVPDSLNQVVLAALAKNPDDRPPSARALMAQLEFVRASPSQAVAGDAVTVGAQPASSLNAGTTTVSPVRPRSPLVAPVPGTQTTKVGRRSVGSLTAAAVVAGGLLIVGLILGTVLLSGESSGAQGDVDAAAEAEESAVVPSAGEDNTDDVAAVADPEGPIVDEDPLGEAERLIEAGDADRALPLAEKILAEDPTNVAALVVQGRALSSLGDHEGGIEALSVADELAPDRSDIGAFLADAELASAPESLVAIDDGTDLGNGPSGMLLTSDHLWIAMSGQRSVLQLPRDGSEISTEISLGRLPDHVVGDDEVVWTAAATDQQLWRIDPVSTEAAMAATYPAYPAALTVDEAGRVFAVLWNEPDLASTIARYDPATGDLVISEVLVDHAAPDIIFAHDRIWISTWNGVSVVDADSLEIVDEIPIVGSARNLEANDRYVFTDVRRDDRSALVRITPDDLAVEELTVIDDALVRIAIADRLLIAVTRRSAVHFVATAAPTDQTVSRDLGLSEVNARDVKVDGDTLLITHWLNPDATGGQLLRYQIRWFQRSKLESSG